jgi:hypothetical protein
MRETVDILPVGPVKYNGQGSPSIRSFCVGFEKHLSNVKLVGSLSRVATATCRLLKDELTCCGSKVLVSLYVTSPHACLQ